MGSIHLIDGSESQRLSHKLVHGSPCNGCPMEPCGIAREFIPDHPEEGPCLATEFNTGRFACGMIRRPGYYIQLPDQGDAHMGALFAEALGAGKGCDADDPELHLTRRA